MAWEQLDDPPEWLLETARELRERAVAGRLDGDLFGTERIYHGSNHVYKIEFTHRNHGHRHNYYRQLKSEFFETDNQEGTCPNCQKYVRRLEGDDVLTCHRCGWEYDHSPSSVADAIRDLIG